jgi:hypothetical protein
MGCVEKSLFIPNNLNKFKMFNKKKKKGPNYKLHLLTLVKVQFNPLNFDRINSVL